MSRPNPEMNWGSMQPLPAAGEPARILIVDDDELVRNVFREYLGDSYICATAEGCDEALGMLRREQVDLVISDVIMPGRGGVDLLRKVVAEFPGTPVIMVSGVDRTQRVIDAMRLGAADYLVKPCELEVLGLTVERALATRALHRQARQQRLDLERGNEELRRSKSALERLQAQLVHGEKMASLGQLAAGVAHELNNPAAFIFGNMEILSGCVSGLRRLLKFYDGARLPPGEEAAARLIKDEIDYENTLDDLSSIISDCHEGAERIRDVVQNLRIFSRLDEAEFKKVDIHEGLDSTVRLLARFYSSGQIRLRREYGELPPVDCYAGQLNQVWMNLLVNAAQATLGGGEVCVSTRAEGESAVIEVRDTGCGIDRGDLKRIFDPFFTTKPVGEGTGLGLSVTHGIIERHGGIIEVTSEPGHGSTFKITIPINAKPGRAGAAGEVTE